MSFITRYSNWCYYDQLDGVNLEDGELLNVLFPDEIERVVAVSLQKHTQYVMEQGGHNTPIPIRQAYYETACCGVMVKIPLIGLPAERIKR
jgi:hypothetical protein